MSSINSTSSIDKKAWHVGQRLPTWRKSKRKNAPQMQNTFGTYQRPTKKIGTLETTTDSPIEAIANAAKKEDSNDADETQRIIATGKILKSRIESDCAKVVTLHTAGSRIVDLTNELEEYRRLYKERAKKPLNLKDCK